MKKKTIKRIAVLALLLALAAVGLGGYLLATMPEDPGMQIEELRRENAQLRDDVQKLREELEKFMTISTLKGWELQAMPWPDSTGADVNFTAIPSEYQQGMGATLQVMLGDRLATSVPCVWDGTAFRATANLETADGYSYLCLLSGPNGVQQLALTGPESEDAGIPVYLQSAISSYCNLVVNDWVEEDGEGITLTDAYAQVQLPRIPEALTIASQELVLRLNGVVSASVPITLTASEVAGSYELTITDLNLPMPELLEGDTLELYLEVSLSDGRHLQAFGIGWDMENEALTSSVG